jgi:outer membrane protein assembly factor BamD
LKKLFFIIGVFFACCFLLSCSTEFEKVRMSNDPQKILVKANEYYENKDYGNAQALYELAIQSFRGKTEAEDIFINYAFTYYYLREYITASHYFKNYASTFINSPRREEADFMAAYSHYAMSPNHRLDQSYSLKAIDGFQEFMNKYPQSDRIEECNRLIDEMRLKLEKKSFDQGILYFNIGQYQAATRSFENMIKDFPGSKFDEEAKYYLIKSSYILASNSIIDKQDERYKETLDYYNKYGAKIRNRNFSKELSLIIKNTNKHLNTKGV